MRQIFIAKDIIDFHVIISIGKMYTILTDLDNG